MKILFTSDLHGEIYLYRQLWEQTRAAGAKIIILGGDLLPALRSSGRYEEMLLHQKNFIVDFLHPFFAQCLETLPVERILLIAGNWDVGYPFIFSQPRERVIDLNQKVCPLEKGYEFFGYPFIPPTPFRPKDYEKMDDPDAPWPPQKNPSYILSPDQTQLLPIDPHSFLGSRGTIRDDLKEFPQPKSPRKAIYVMHSPPWRTSLDLIRGGSHGGSRAIRSFIEERQPLLTLHGHIHESPEVSGKYFDRLEGTLCVNPGQSLGKEGRSSDLYAVTFEMEAPKETLGHSRFS